MIDSVRGRITLWYMGVLGLTLLAFSIGVYGLLARNMERRFDEGLRSSLGAARNLLILEGSEGESALEMATSTVTELRFPNTTIAIFDSSGQLLAESIAAEDVQAGLPVASATITEAVTLYTRTEKKADTTGNWRIAAQRVTAAPDKPQFLIVLRQSNQVVAEELESLRQVLYLAVSLALVFAGLGGWLLARKSLAPVARMAGHARRINAENLSERLPIANSRDELGQLAVTFNQLLGRLDASFDRQRQFMADASHELRTPLHVIGTAADVSLSNPARTEDEYRDALVLIRQQTRRLTHIVEDMFMLARADAGRRELEIADFYLDELVTETVRAAQLLAERKGVLVTLDSESEIPYRGDEGLIRQMLLNLLDNAIKHTPAKGTVRVVLVPSKRAMEISVTDSGPGIPPEAQPHIFERFYRVDKARARTETPTENGRGSGAGLGLAISRWVAEIHNGRLDLLQSNAGGSTFVISLPLKQI